MIIDRQDQKILWVEGKVLKRYLTFLLRRNKIMIVFHSDLDHTLIYSYKHEIGQKKRCVEIYQGREISFMTEHSFELLQKIRRQVVLVPTTTRTIEQYQRIDLGGEMPEYALVCNGGILLVQGQSDQEWYQESRKMIQDCQEDLHMAEEILQTDPEVNFEVRNIEQLFLFTKSVRPERTICRLRERLGFSQVEVFSNGTKVYAVPEKLNKGQAVRRFRQKVQADLVTAAGDSRFDLPMLTEADLGLADWELKKEMERIQKVRTRGFGKEKRFGQEKNLEERWKEKRNREPKIFYLGKERIFSDDLLEYLQDYISSFALESAGKK